MTILLKPVLLVLGLVASAAASTPRSDSTSSPFNCGGIFQPKCTPDNVCGKLNIVLSGLVYNDPQVIAAGFNPAQVAAAMAADKAEIVRLGYNIKAILVGSNNTHAISDISGELRGTRWAATGVGYGVRGSRDPGVTYLFTDIIKLYRAQVPNAPTLFNFSPNSTNVVIQREFPLPAGVSCEGHPGKDLGTVMYP